MLILFVHFMDAIAPMKYPIKSYFKTKTLLGIESIYAAGGATYLTSLRQVNMCAASIEGQVSGTHERLCVISSNPDA